MKLIVDEKSFKETIEAHEKVLVFFYVEKGCPSCDKMKPVIEGLSNDHDILFYKCGDDLKTAMPDSITQGLVEMFPTYAAYINGKLVGRQVGEMKPEQVLLTFTPDLIPKKLKSIEELPLVQLLTDEAAMIDQIYPMMNHLKKIQKEIKKRKSILADEACCDSCDEGGSCAGGCK